MTKVSIIILTYNSTKYIEKLIKGIDEFNEGEDFEIVVVDNASSDNTVEIIQNLKVKNQNFKSKIKIIENERNYGFAKGINMGSKQASGEYLLFVNPDAEWNSGSIDDLVSVFEGNEKIGVVGGKLIDKNGHAEKSAGKFLGFWESFLTAFGLDEVFGIRFSPNEYRQVDFVSGGFMAVRKKLFDSLSGFDENLFIYVEDMEFCFRAKKAGLLTYFVPNVILEHESHGSSTRGFAIKNIHKGIFYFQKKHANALSFLVIKLLFGAKAAMLVIIGKILNNKYLAETYSEALKA